MKKLKFFIGYLLLVFIIQEVVFRVSFPIPELSNFDRALFVLKADQKGQFVRNKSFAWWSLPDTSAPNHIDYNMYGFRGDEWKLKRSRNKKRIMFVGDSFVEGIMAPSAQTIPEAFRSSAKNQEIEVMNAGMLGVGMQEYLQFIADAVPIFRPNVVFLVVYANDFTSNDIQIPAFNLAEKHFDRSKPRAVELLTQYREGNPVPFRKSLSRKKLLPNKEDPSFPFKGKVDKMYLHADSALVEKMCKAEFNPYKLNEMFRSEKELREVADFTIPIDFFRYYSEKYKFEPIVVYIPARNQVTDYYLQFDHRSSLKFNRALTFTSPMYNRNQQLLQESCKSLGVTFMDLTDVVKNEESVGNHLFWNFDDHMRGKGYQIIGEELYERWSER